VQIFNYDPATGRYLGASKADSDPMRPGEFLEAAFTTRKEPPTAPVGHVAVFDRQADAWGLHALTAQEVADEANDPASPEGMARAERERLLRACDWVVLRAYEADERVPEAWAAYRQALRDVPSQEGFPDSVNWPQAPAA
jgi:hypothetical protein